MQSCSSLRMLLFSDLADTKVLAQNRNKEFAAHDVTWSARHFTVTDEWQ